MNGTIHCHQNFIIDINLSHHYGKIFRPQLVILRPTKLKKCKYPLNTSRYFSDGFRSQFIWHLLLCIFSVFKFLWFDWPRDKHIRLKHVPTTMWCFSETLVNFYQATNITSYKTIIFLGQHTSTFPSHTTVHCDIIC